MAKGGAGIWISAALLIGPLLTSCTATPEPPPPPFEAPACNVATRHFAGTILTGPRPVEAAGTFDLVTVRIVALERFADDILTPISEGARLIARRGDRATLAATPRLAPASRFGFGSEAEDAYQRALAEGTFGRSQGIAALAGAVTAGVTVRFAVESAQQTASSRQALLSTGYAVEVERGPTGPARVALVVSGWVTPAVVSPDSEEEPQPAPPTPVLQEEAVLLGDLPADDRQVAVLLARSPSVPGQGIVFVVEVHTGPYAEAEAHADAVARCQADLAAGVLEGVLDPNRAPIWAGLTEALAALVDPVTRRGSLAFLGRATGAVAAEDVALAGTDDLLAEVADGVCAATGELPAASDSAALGWVLERTTLEVLAQGLDAEQPAPALEALLVRHAGEAGRSRAFVEEVLGRCANLEELAAELVRENVFFLLDKSPAARVRAYDWLVGRGAAPPGYDPLSDRQQRRAAMSRWQAAQEGEQ